MNIGFSQTPFLNKIWKIDLSRSSEFNYNYGKYIPIDSQMIYFNSPTNNYTSPIAWMNKYTLYDKFHYQDTSKIEPKDISYIPLLGDTGHLFYTKTGTLIQRIKKLNTPIKTKYYKVNWYKLDTQKVKNFENCIEDSMEREFNYTSSSFQCKNNTNVPFYLEISIKTPTSNHTGSQFNFFNYASESELLTRQPLNADTLTWSEIDIFEYSGTDKVFTHNIHHIPKYQNRYVLNSTNFDDMEKKNIKINEVNWVSDINVNNSIPMDTTLKNGFHKFGIEVTKTYIAYYLDDNQIDFVYFPQDLIYDINGKTEYFPSHLNKKPRIGENLSILLNAHVNSGFRKNDTSTINTHFPIDYEIDYIRYYKLDNNKISNSNLIVENYNLSDHNEYIYNKIILGKNLNINTVKFNTTNKTTTLRAKEYIELNDGFSVNINDEIYIIDTLTDNN